MGHPDHHHPNHTKPASDRARRQFFRSLSGRGAIRRPPWTGDDFTEACVRCAACQALCPNDAIVMASQEVAHAQ